MVSLHADSCASATSILTSAAGWARWPATYHALQEPQLHGVEQEQVSNPVGDYGRADLTTYRLPKPYAFPVYNAAQSGQCNVYVPPYSTLSR